MSRGREGCRREYKNYCHTVQCEQWMLPNIAALPSGSPSQNPPSIDTKRGRYDNMIHEARKLREKLERLETEANDMERELTDIEKDLQEGEDGVIPILNDSTLWQKYPCAKTILGDPIIVDKDDQEEIVRVFQEIAGRVVDSDMANDWFNEIPTEAELTLGDVHKIKTQGLELPVLVPQHWTNVSTLAANDFMFHGNNLQGETLRHPYGLFRGFGRIWDPGYIEEERLQRYPVDPAHFTRAAVSGSGSDPWFKLHPALLQHARAWAVWDQR